MRRSRPVEDRQPVGGLIARHVSRKFGAPLEKIEHRVVYVVNLRTDGIEVIHGGLLSGRIV